MLFNDFKLCQGAADVKGRALYVKGKGNMCQPTKCFINPPILLTRVDNKHAAEQANFD